MTQHSTTSKNNINKGDFIRCGKYYGEVLRVYKYKAQVLYFGATIEAVDYDPLTDLEVIIKVENANKYAQQYIDNPKINTDKVGANKLGGFNTRATAGNMVIQGAVDQYLLRRKDIIKYGRVKPKKYLY